MPKISVVVRKAYGAGLYAMCGPGFAPDATLALPTAMIAVMGADAAVNAVYSNRIQAIETKTSGLSSSRSSGLSTTRTSTSSGSPASCASTPSSSPLTCAVS